MAEATKPLKTLAFLESCVENLKKDFSKRIEMNCFLIFGFLVAQYLLLKKLQVDLRWAALLPCIFFLLYAWKDLIKNIQEGRETGNSDFLSLGLTAFAVVLSSIVACFYLGLLASDPVNVLKTILNDLPLSPIILAFVLTIPLRRWLGKCGMITTYGIAFILVITKDPHALGIGH